MLVDVPLQLLPTTEPPLASREWTCVCGERSFLRSSVGKVAVLEDVGKFSYHGRTMIIISCYIQWTSLQIEGVIAVPVAALPPDSLIAMYGHPAMGS